MHPYIKISLFSNELLKISSYRLFFILACVAVLSISFLIIKKKQLPLVKSAVMLTAMALTVPVGARILHLITNPIIYQRNWDKLWALQLTGFSLMGGLILAALTGVILSRLLRLDLWPLADSIAPGLGAGLVLMRIGCYFNGCCFGEKTNLPWAVHFPAGSIPYKYYLPGLLEKETLSPFALFSSPAIHPTQLYELAAALLITAVTIYLLRREAPAGIPFLVFALLFAAFRWFNSTLRVPAETLSIAPWFYPLLYSAIILLCLLLLLKKN